MEEMARRDIGSGKISGKSGASALTESRGGVTGNRSKRF